MAPPTPKHTILLADDDPLIVATLAAEFRAADFGVLEAFTGASALEACVAHKPSLAIVDYSMPEMSGVELTRLIAARTSTPVVFLSAYSEDSIVAEAIAAGAMTYLVKPIDSQQLIPVVRAALQRSRELQALRQQTDQLNSALQSGRNVNIATGVVMAKFRIGQQAAFELLRHQARSKRTRLEEIATELLRVTDEADRLYESLSRADAARVSRRGNTEV